uniref:SprT-like domain-containing protein n=1 Tax=Auxenochlorella protothecoides TaxID=3075 RepID=A0A1D1ZPK1_AUXPR
MLVGSLDCFPDLELLDPTVDIHAMFLHYNNLYFEDSLGACSVEWSSKRMTSCGGVCEFRGGGCTIKLSEPLLKFRPVADIKAVLLHEMIHAHNFLVGSKDDGRDGHGSVFQAHMRRINACRDPDPLRPLEGYNITIRHSMLDEVAYYQNHHWSCPRCGHLVRRAMNRPPQEADCWRRAGPACADPRCGWHVHLRHCGGTYVKVKEPEGYKPKTLRREEAGKQQAGPSSAALPGPTPAATPPAGHRPITGYFQPAPSHGATAGSSSHRNPDSIVSAASNNTAANVQGQHNPRGGSKLRSRTPDGCEEDIHSRRAKLAAAALARFQAVPPRPPSRPPASPHPGQETIIDLT